MFHRSQYSKSDVSLSFISALQANLDRVGSVFRHFLSMMRGEPWKNLRATVLPTFSPAKMRAVNASLSLLLSMFSFSAHAVDRTVRRALRLTHRNQQRWCCRCEGVSASLALRNVTKNSRSVNRYTLDSIGATLFGVAVNDKEQSALFLHHANGVFDDFGSPFNTLLFFLFCKCFSFTL